jgi:hypothetical protein
MRIKILMLGDEPVSQMVDAQILRERGMLVYTAFNPDNIGETINEIKPDIVFFNPRTQNGLITDVYNNMVNGIYFTNIPVIYTLSEDDVYLVTRKRTETKAKRSIIADNMIEAIKMAMGTNKTFEKKIHKIPASKIPAASCSVQ